MQLTSKIETAARNLASALRMTREGDARLKVVAGAAARLELLRELAIESGELDADSPRAYQLHCAVRDARLSLRDQSLAREGAAEVVAALASTEPTDAARRAVAGALADGGGELPELTVDEGIEELRHEIKRLQDGAHPTLRHELAEVRRGRKYAKLVVDGAAFCFVDLESGDVLKAASWKSPAKHARGNVCERRWGRRTPAVSRPVSIAQANRGKRRRGNRRSRLGELRLTNATVRAASR